MAKKSKASKKRRKNRLNKKRNMRSAESMDYEALEPRQLLATFTVTANADAFATGTLRSAILSANFTNGPDIIDLSAISGQTINLNPALGELLIRDSVTIRGAGVTIDANDRSRVLNFVGPDFDGSSDETIASGLDLTLENLTIREGLTDGTNFNRNDSNFNLDNDNFFSGGGIRFNSTGTLKLDDTTVTESQTEGTLAHGGGIFSIGPVELTDGSEVSSNRVGGKLPIGVGLGTFVVDAIEFAKFSPAAVLIDTFLLTERPDTNPGSSARGGGIYSRTEVLVDDSSVIANSTSGDGGYGGGISAMEQVTVQNDSYIGLNYTRQNDSPGGGIHAGGFVPDATDSDGFSLKIGKVTINDSTVEKNFTLDRQSSGGGISADIVVIENSSVVQDNHTVANGSTGGGIFSEGPLTLENSMLHGNTTDGGTGPLVEVGCKLGIAVVSAIVGKLIPAGSLAAAANDLFGKFGMLNTVAGFIPGAPTLDLEPCPTSDGSFGFGGGADARAISVINSEISGNRTTGYGGTGGGLNSAAGVYVKDSRFHNNGTTSFQAKGGAINSGGKVEVRDSLFTSNFTTSGNTGGGAISAADVYVYNSDFSGNSTKETTAILSRGGGSRGGAIQGNRVFVHDSYFAGNSTFEDRSSGGAIFGREGVSVFSSVFRLNSTGGETDTNVYGSVGSRVAKQGGGGAVSGKNVYAFNSTFDSNYTTGEGADGGAIFAERKLEITNSTVVNNEARGLSTDDNQTNGGGLSTRGTLNIVSSTITGNFATNDGGGAYSRSQINIENSIVLSNRAGSGDGHELDAREIDSRNVNIVGTSENSNNVTVVPQNFTGVSFTAAPVSSVFEDSDTRTLPNGFFLRSGELGDHGGSHAGVDGSFGIVSRSSLPIQTVRLEAQNTNPAIDANELSTDTAFNFDQRGISKDFVFNSALTPRDAGAFEATLNLLVTTASRFAEPGETSLSDAILSANIISGPNEITFADDLSGEIFELGQSLQRISEAVTINASSLDAPIVISGRNNSRIFDFTPSIGNLELVNLILTDGRTSADNSDSSDTDESGGAIRSESAGRVILRDSVVSNSQTRGDFAEGGGIFAEGTVVLIDSDVTNNRTVNALGAKGGGISANVVRIYGDSAVSFNVTEGTDADGGGIYASYGAYLYGSSLISNNTTMGDDSSGGGIFAGENVTLSDSVLIQFNLTVGDDSLGGGVAANNFTADGGTVYANTTTGTRSDGGGVHAGNVVITNSLVAGNGTFGLNSGGGGIDSTSNATLSKSTLRENFAAGGASGSNESGGGGLNANNATISDSTIVSNFTSGARTQGGGIYSRSLSLTNSTVTGNSTASENSRGGGIYTFQTSEITNSIVLGNFANSSPSNEVDLNPGLQTFLGNNIIGETAADFDASVSANVRNVQLTSGGAIEQVFREVEDVRFDSDGDGVAESTVTGRDAGVAQFGGGLTPTVALEADMNNPAIDSTVAPESLFSFEGNANDGFANNNGTFNGGLTATANGIRGNAVQFTGNIQQSVALDPLSIGSSSSTVELWVNIPSNAPSQIMSILGDAQLTTLWGIDAQGRAGFSFRDGSDTQARITGTTDLRGKGWVHIAFVRDTASNSLEVFVDGESEGVSTSDGPNGAFSSNFTIGSFGGFFPLTGTLDELTIHERALNSSEIRSLASQFDQRGDGFERVISPELIGGGTNGPSRQDIGAFEVEAFAEQESLVVTTSQDVVNAFDGETSLREAILFANDPTAGINQNGDADNNGSIKDSITFDASLSGSTIVLQQGELEITQSLSVTGTSTAGGTVDAITIDANDQSRIFNFSPTSGDLNVTFLRMVNGRTTGDQDHGGALRFNSEGELQLNYISVEDSSTTGPNSRGGGIFSKAAVTFIDQSSISNNRTFGDSAFGGGAYLRGTPTLTSVTISGNGTTGFNSHGGGLFSSAGSTTLRNTTLSGNFTHDGDGGGAFVPDLLLVNSTVSSNTAGEGRQGGGIYTTASLDSRNSIILGNLSFDGIGNEIGPSNRTVVFGGQNIVGRSDADFDTTGVTGVMHASPQDVFAGVGRPRFDSNGDGKIDVTFPGSAGGLLQDNGGNIPTIALRPSASNPAIDSGVNGLAQIYSDARGNNTRVVDLPGAPNNGFNSIDLGAFEVQANANEVPSLVVTTDLDIVNPNDFFTSLREAITYAEDPVLGGRITFATGAGDAFENGGTIVLTGGELKVSNDLEINADFAGSPVIIDANDASRVLHVDDTNLNTNDVLDDVNVTLNNLELINGKVTGNEIDAADTTLSGGAIRFNSTGILTIRDSLVADSEVDLAAGGGIFAAGTVELFNSTVRSNKILGVGTGNVAEGVGAGLFAQNASLYDSTVYGNDSNVAFGRGGGIYTIEDVSLSRSTVRANRTFGDGADGGGIAAGGSAFLDRVTIAGNRTFGDNVKGAGLYSDDARIYSSTFSGNYHAGAGSVGGGLAANSIRVVNSLMLGNVSKLGTDHEIANLGTDPLTFFGKNLIGTDTTVFDASMSLNVDNAAVGDVFRQTFLIEGTNVESGFITNNGGTVETIELKAIVANPALDAAQDNFFGFNQNLLASDLADARGQNRFFDLLGFRNDHVDVSDIGAFELTDRDDSSITLGSLIVTTNVGDGDPFDGQVSLREAVSYSQLPALAASPVVTFASGPGEAFEGNTTIFLTAQTGGIGSEGGDIDVQFSVVIDGTGTNNLTIDGELNNKIFQFGTDQFDGATGQFSPGGQVFTVRNLTLANGQSQNLVGGAIQVGNSSTLQNQTLILDNVVIKDSIADQGGAIHATNTDLQILNSAFINNVATGFSEGSQNNLNNSGSAIYINNGDGFITNSTISGNGVANQGGNAIYHRATDSVSSLGIRNVTIADNFGDGINTTANSGSAVTLTIGNSVLANNSGANITNLGSFNLVSEGSNVLDDNTPGFGGSDLRNTDPQLTGIDTNQSSPVQALAPTSSAVDFGNDALLTRLVRPTVATSSVPSAVMGSPLGPNNLIQNNAITESNFRTTPDPDTDPSGPRTWLTNDVGSDYFVDGGEVPVLEFSLSRQELINSVAIWGNSNSADNDIRNFTIELSSDGGLTYDNAFLFTKPIYTDTDFVNILPFGANFVANHVRFTIFDNYGGDRVGFNEIRFLSNLTSDQRGDGFDRDVDGNFDGNTQTDAGAFELRNRLVVDAFGDIDDGIETLGELTIREAVRLANDTPGADTITFDAGLAGQTITLGGSQLEISDSVTIDGLGVDQLTISGNDASRVFLIDDDNDNTEIDVTLRGLTIRDGNTTSGSANTGRGAGIQNKENLTLEDVAVRSNRSDLIPGSIGSRGGGLAHSLGELLVIASTFADNSSLDSGGIDVASGSVEIVNSTFYGNTVRGNGAAIRVQGTDTTVTVRNSTITGNTADDNGNQSNQAGGIQSISGTVTLHNTLVVGNFGGTDGEINDLAGTFSSDSSNNLIGEQDSGVSLNNDTNGNIVGDGSGGALPLVSILTEQATSVPGLEDTLEFFLIEGSPAVNAGSNAQAIDVDGDPLTTDQFGNTRIQNGTVDIGSRESDFDDVVATAPVITNIVRDEGGVLARPDLINTYAVTFDQDVNVMLDDLFIVNELTGEIFFADNSPNLSLSYDSSSRTATWDLGSLSLSAAFYTFQLSDDIAAVAGGLSLDGDGDGTAGGLRDDEVYVAIPGDANLDGQVNVLGDAFLLVGNLGTAGGATWAQGDFNEDGNVNVLGDAFILVGNLGQDVRPPMNAATLATAQLPSASTSPNSLAQVALPTDPVSNADDQDDSTNEDGPTSPPSESPQLVLAGNHDLRDDVFGSDF